MFIIREDIVQNEVNKKMRIVVVSLAYFFCFSNMIGCADSAKKIIVNLNNEKVNKLLLQGNSRAFSHMLRCYELGTKVLGVAGLCQLKQKGKQLDADDQLLIERLKKNKTKICLLWYDKSHSYSKNISVKKVVKLIIKGKIGIFKYQTFSSSPDRILD